MSEEQTRDFVNELKDGLNDLFVFHLPEWSGQTDGQKRILSEILGDVQDYLSDFMED